MSLFDLQDVCIAIGSLATLDLPMIVDLIGIYVMKGPYCTLTTTNWFLQALSVIPSGSWRDVARRFTMIRWASPKSESEDDIQCLMTDDTEEVFDFSNLEFTREDLVTILNDMVQEYKKLSESFKEVKVEKKSCATKVELVSSSEMQAVLSKLSTENDELRSRSQEMLNENLRLSDILSS
ncbi:acyl-CoA dehydrogenase-related protein [Dorcoceras hygrometricum]|uniref:Acyl-CoA dehydrogenase-related protein n=1 Tax=Dorcoceras hygrometricum TaxID=472368 RepID=A0A2Z7ACP3_9LAMI|nr:acyl-CoA dehydrogenase-related protein [Dorcoceras hygrometricum]